MADYLKTGHFSSGFQKVPLAYTILYKKLFCMKRCRLVENLIFGLVFEWLKQKDRPLKYWTMTQMDHSNTGLIWYSDGHCITKQNTK
jgi:hypothetical protein